MISVVSCIIFEHDLRLVLMAAIMCVVGAITVVNLFRRSCASVAHARIAWSILTSIATGASIWSTHFISMLAYQAEIPVRFDVILTMVSLLIPMTLMSPLIYLATKMRKQNVSIVIGGAIGLVVSSIHYLGMAAYRVDGVVEWNTTYVIASIIIPVVFCTATFGHFPKYKFMSKRLISIAAFTVAVVGLHFTAMTAINIIPFNLSDMPMSTDAFYGMAMATAAGGFLVLVTGLVSFVIDSSTREANNQEIERLVATDPLTDLPNRRSFREHIENTLAGFETNPLSNFAVLYIDINGFKVVNDTLGYSVGDVVLKTFADRMSETLSSGEYIARLGKDEFAAVKVYNSANELEAFVQKVEDSIEIPIEVEEESIELDLAIGIACCPTDGHYADELTSNAELALRRAKSNASDSICYYDANMDDVVRHHREMVRNLRQAILKNELQLYYQMQANVQTGELKGFEALLRWTHPEKGPISPALFIPIAEENGLIIQLGDWVLKQACKEAALWEKPYKVAVNLSPMQLMQPNLPKRIHEILLDTGLSANRLEIELTETAIFEDRERSVHVLRQIKALGVKVALDDFGTGYSSLEVLRSFPFDKIKLDRFFMDEIETSSVAKAFLRSVLALGRNLSIPVLAEGVETENQLRILQEEGCDAIQGFLLHKPSREVPFEHNLDFADTHSVKSAAGPSDNLFSMVKLETRRG